MINVIIYCTSPEDIEKVNQIKEALKEKSITMAVLEGMASLFEYATISKSRNSCGTCGREIFGDSCMFCDKPLMLPGKVKGN